MRGAGMRKRSGALALLATMCWALAGQGGGSLVVYAGEIPPMSFAAKDGSPGGIAVEILGAVAKKTGTVFDIQVLPWARAQAQTKEAKTAVGIVPLSRTAEREGQYSWVAELYEQRMVFVTYGGTEPPRTIEQARALRIGTLDANMMVKLLPGLGFTKVETASTEDTNVRKLAVGRIDAWLVSDLVAKTVFRDLGEDPAKLRIGMAIGDPLKVYLGGSLAFPAQLSGSIQAAVKALRDDGTIAAILARYR